MTSSRIVHSDTCHCRIYGKQTASVLCPYDQIEIVENLTQRLSHFNAALGQIRHGMVTETTKNHSLFDKFFSNKTVLIVPGDSEDLMARLSNFSTAITLFLPWAVRRSGRSQYSWNSSDALNLPVRNYFAWTMDARLCDYVNKAAATSKWSSPLDMRSCTDNFQGPLSSISLHPAYVQWKQILRVDQLAAYKSEEAVFEGHLFTVPQYSPLQIHVITGAIVTHAGDIYTDSYKLVSNGCLPSYANRIRRHWLKQPLLKEVFVISQEWGHQIFHGMIESMPRVAPFVEFLKKNPLILIHVWKRSRLVADLLQLLGIDRSRLVSGVVRAYIVYVTKATPCFSADLQNTQLLNSIYRNYVRLNFPVEPRNRLIMIRRSGNTVSGMKKYLKQQKAIEDLVEVAAKDFSLTYTLFDDNPVPSLNDTMRLFHSAVMIVSVHGAGESNIVFSAPGLYIVEITCNPIVQAGFCYKHLAQALGHHWHGVMSISGCPEVVDIEPWKVAVAVRRLLEVWSRENRT
jgi:Glycosyltransferase 61